jgi:hypothetical protein
VCPLDAAFRGAVNKLFYEGTVLRVGTRQTEKARSSPRTQTSVVVAFRGASTGRYPTGRREKPFGVGPEKSSRADKMLLAGPFGPAFYTTVFRGKY